MLDFNFLNLSPFISLTLSAVLVMLVVAFKRDHFLIACLTFLGFIATIFSLRLTECEGGSQITMLLRCDPQTNFFNELILLASAVVVIFCYSYFKLNFYDNETLACEAEAPASETDDTKPKELEYQQNLPEEAYILLLTATLGAMVLMSADHFASLFLGLETLALSLFALVAYPSVNQKLITPIEAGIKYLILSGVTSAFLCFGIALIYFDTGILSFADLPKMSDPAYNESLIFMTGVVMILGAFAFKLSLVPFHMWTPDIYQGSPTAITSYIASVSKTASIIIFLKLFILMEIYSNEILTMIISFIAMLSMLAGNILALLQKNLMRLLAYSSIAHMGYLLIAYLAINAQSISLTNEAVSVSAMSNIGVDALSYYLIAYLVTTLAAFGVINAITLDGGKKNISEVSELQGLFWLHPLMSLVLITAFLSLAGIPLTIGFIGKFYLVSAAVDSQLWTLLGVLVISNAIGLYYYLNVIITMLKPKEQDTSQQKASMSNQLLAVTLAALILALGLYPTPLISKIKHLSKSGQVSLLQRADNAESGLPKKASKKSALTVTKLEP